jgi:TPR repeat protein
MYVHGVGVVRDLVRAEKWLLAADAQGDGEASYALSELYALGGRGIEKSEYKAGLFRQNSAVAGFAPVRSEFLRLLDNPPPVADQPPPRSRRRHYRNNSGDSDE